ncbi:MAG: hypothetical protein U1C33_05405, partial [Candidatus Cloacimonadaceae bacterium]|nr:hypothetical protein [Candidatus Cloacimonadaceae bacterium]
IKINLYCRCVSRVFIDLGTFYADSFRALHKGFEALPLMDFLRGDNPPEFCFHVASFSSSLYHEKAVSERLMQSLSKLFAKELVVVPTVNDFSQLLIIHIKNNRVSVKLDSSGIHLHKRGYGKFTEAAPLRETIAAAMIYDSGVLSTPSGVLDPMCGSGTIPIEAAFLQSKVLWDEFRSFGFMRWKTYDPELLLRAKQSILFPEYSPRSVIASETDPKTVSVATENIRKAKLAESISISQRDFLEYSTKDVQDTVIITNPPWGKRLDSNPEIDKTLQKLGKKAAGLFIISPQGKMKGFSVRFSVKSGDIRLFILKYNKTI